jgi:hypothetical protein
MLAVRASISVRRETSHALRYPFMRSVMYFSGVKRRFMRRPIGRGGGVGAPSAGV